MTHLKGVGIDIGHITGARSWEFSGFSPSFSRGRRNVPPNPPLEKEGRGRGGEEKKKQKTRTQTIWADRGVARVVESEDTVIMMYIIESAAMGEEDSGMKMRPRGAVGRVEAGVRG